MCGTDIAYVITTATSMRYIPFDCSNFHSVLAHDGEKEKKKKKNVAA